MKANRELVQLLCPYGNWSHSKGMQLVDKTSAEKIRNSFMRGFDRIWGVPIYIGHPDDSPSNKRPQAVGKIESICVTEEGIAVSAIYSEKAFEKIESGKLKWLSPRWQMQKLKDGRFRPIRLISVGMTNNPNIPKSGTILSSKKASDANFALASQRVKGAASKCQAFARKLEETALSAEKISDDSRALKIQRIDQALKKLKEKPAPQELADMAIRRSKETGEAYYEAFAAIRRKFYGANSAKKIGASRASANTKQKI